MKLLRWLLRLDERDRARAAARAELVGADVLLDEARAASTRAEHRLELLERRAAIAERRRA